MASSMLHRTSHLKDSAATAAACSSGKGGSSAAPSASTAGSSTTASASTVAAQQASTVSVHMKEFSLAPQPSSDPAGKVTFKAVNDGKVTHELVVLNTDRAPGALPVAKGKADETGDLGRQRILLPAAQRASRWR